MVLFWISVLAFSILLYVLLDGFDFGVGMLFGLARDEDRRRQMMGSVAPVWDGNETWLIVSGVVLWGAFPIVYATLFSAFYLPLIFMLAGLILRGVAFEFRERALHFRIVWGLAFCGGSLLAAFMQGVMVGALVEGLPVSHGAYAGSDFSWLSPFAVLCGVGLCLGYSLLGACWLVRKCVGETQSWAYPLIARLSAVLGMLLVLVFVLALALNLRVMQRWLERPYLFVFPVIGVVAAIVLSLSVRRRHVRAPGYAVAATFVAAFATFAITFWPYMVPFSITVDQAAAPHASLAFMFWGEGLFVLPLMLIYTIIGYRVFRSSDGTNSSQY